MPALANPRWERFALALFAGLDGKTRIERAQSTAYLAAYPNCKPGNSAESAASQLLRRIKPITERVRELQAEANARLQPKLDLSRERVGRNLDYASQLAKQQDNPTAIVNSELAIAKVFHRFDTQNDNQLDFKSARSMQEIGKKLMQSVGVDERLITAEMVQAAIEANNTFIAQIEAISDSHEQTMPPQLARSNRWRDRHTEPRPTIELMPAININELRHAIPRYHGQVNEPDVSLKYPNL